MGRPNPEDISRAEALMSDLAERPFIALVMDEGEGVRIYTKGVSEDELADIQSMLMGSDEEED